MLLLWGMGEGISCLEAATDTEYVVGQRWGCMWEDLDFMLTAESKQESFGGNMGTWVKGPLDKTRR